MKTSTALLIVATAALGACNSADSNRTTKAPAGGATTVAITSPSAPPAPTERTPIPANANTMAAGTDASTAFQQAPAVGVTAPVASGTASSPTAQNAVANAPDTASADAAKAAAAGDPAKSGGTAQDTAANSPRSGTLTKQEESTEMPKAGQANNHSSTALENDSGKKTQP